MRMTLLEICRQLEVTCVGMAPEAGVERPTGAAIDSRAVKRGDLFFCLKGERTDGHNFAAAAIANGAVALVCSRSPFPDGVPSAPALVVADPEAALAALATAHRAVTRAKVVGVTGTSGKTSVKETLASVLSLRGETAKTHMNFNNQIGLPLSMLNASESAAYWVMEAGISRPNDMNELGEIFKPDVALILNAGAGHVQELGDKGVAYYKARLLGHLAPGGVGVVSADYPDLSREVAMYDATLRTFSARNKDADYHAAYLGPDAAGPDGAILGKFSLSLLGGVITVRAPFRGEYGAENVAAVGAAAHVLGATETEIASGFASAKLPAQRCNVREMGAYLFVDDSYNANPLSMRRMLEAAAAMAKERGEALTLVLGEMGELGRESGEFHRQMAAQAASLSPRAFFWKGGQGDVVEEALRAAGYKGPFARVPDAESFMAAFEAEGIDAGVVLFKGSRSNELEQLAAAFAEKTGAEQRKDDAL